MLQITIFILNTFSNLSEAQFMEEAGLELNFSADQPSCSIVSPEVAEKVCYRW